MKARRRANHWTDIRMMGFGGVSAARSETKCLCLVEDMRGMRELLGTSKGEEHLHLHLRAGCPWARGAQSIHANLQSSTDKHIKYIQGFYLTELRCYEQPFAN